MNHRQILANAAYHKLKPIFAEKLCSSDVKLKHFSALVESIFLYNSEIWTLTKKLESEIDSFQRRLLRNLMKYRYTDDHKYWPTTEELYTKTNQSPWSLKIQKRRLVSFFGHVCRLPIDIPVKIALKEAKRVTKNKDVDHEQLS